MHDLPTRSAARPKAAPRPAVVDVITVRALWCALHPDAPTEPVVRELLAIVGSDRDVVHDALFRLRSGRLERSAWVNGAAQTVLEAVLARMEQESREHETPSGTNGTGDDPAPRRTLSS